MKKSVIGDRRASRRTCLALWIQINPHLVEVGEVNTPVKTVDQQFYAAVCASAQARKGKYPGVGSARRPNAD